MHYKGEKNKESDIIRSYEVFIALRSLVRFDCSLLEYKYQYHWCVMSQVESGSVRSVGHVSIPDSDSPPNHIFLRGDE